MGDAPTPSGVGATGVRMTCMMFSAIIACPLFLLKVRQQSAHLAGRDFLFGAGGQLLVDRVLRFERLAEEADELLAQLGLEDRSLPWVNASGSGTPDAVPPYADYYDDESRALVAELYHADIEAFAYEFGD